MADKSFTIHALAQELKAGTLTSVELCRRCLDAVEAKDGEIGAFIKYDAEKIMALAAESDARRQAGKALSDYDGIPVGIKDNICVKGETCSCASKILMLDVSCKQSLSKQGVLLQRFFSVS